MKKLFSVAVIILCSMVVFSCKNNGGNNKCEGECENCTEVTEECCGDHEGGECTKAEGEKCDKCKEAALEALDGIQGSAISDDQKLKGVRNVAEVEVKPVFEGGDANSFMAWVQKNINYPAAARENNEQGKVVVNFVVGKDGKVGDVKVLKGVSETIDAEAVRVVSQSPDWTPATDKGVAVPVNYTLPIVFALK